MKTKLFFFVILGVALATCKKEPNEPNPPANNPDPNPTDTIPQNYTIEFFVHDGIVGGINNSYLSDVGLTINGVNLGPVPVITGHLENDFFYNNPLPQGIQMNLDLDETYNISLYHSINSEEIATFSSGVVVYNAADDEFADETHDEFGNPLTFSGFDAGTGYIQTGSSLEMLRTTYGQTVATTGVEMRQEVGYYINNGEYYIHNNRIFVFFFVKQ